jgi:hypothetical protein
LRQLAAASGYVKDHLFAPAATWRVRRDTNTDTPLPADEPAGENPPDGAIIDYDLPQNAHGNVSLEILDRAGKVLRKYSSDDPVAPTSKELRTQLIPAYWPLRHGPLPKTAGMHRWVWDMRAAAPIATHYEYPISAVPHRTPLVPQGPLVVPGLYTVRLTVDGKSETASLTVKMDPRVHMTQAELETLHSAQTNMAASLDAVAKADIEVHSVMEQLDAVQDKALVAQLATFHKALGTILNGTKDGTKAHGAKQVPGIDEVSREASQLYNELEQADASPTAALLTAVAHVQDEGKAVLPGWENFKQTQIPEMNRELQREHLPAIQPNQRPANMPEEGDED